MHLRAGCEPEMMWLKVDADGKPTVEGMTKPYCYHIDQFSELQPLIHKVMEYGRKMGLDMIQGDHEDAPGQLELNFMFDRRGGDGRPPHHLPPDLPAGRARDGGVRVLHAQAVHGRLGRTACHHNISLWQGDENMFLPEGDNPQMPGKIGLHSIGGVLEHLSALTAITAPDRELVPSLLGRRVLGAGVRRLGLPEPDHRAADLGAGPVRVPLGGLRGEPVPVVRRAARRDEGRSGPQPGPRRSRRSATSTRRSPAARTSRRCRTTSARALDALRADPVIQSALPNEMYKVFMHYKQDEWDRFRATVSEWDIETYLDVLP